MDIHAEWGATQNWNQRCPCQHYWLLLIKTWNRSVLLPLSRKLRLKLFVNLIWIGTNTETWTFICRWSDCLLWHFCWWGTLYGDGWLSVWHLSQDAGGEQVSLDCNRSVINWAAKSHCNIGYYVSFFLTAIAGVNITHIQMCCGSITWWTNCFPWNTSRRHFQNPWRTWRNA